MVLASVVMVAVRVFGVGTDAATSARARPAQSGMLS
jgi:hypothetical protein